AVLAKSGRIVGIRHQINFDLRNLVHPQRFVLMKVCLLDAAFIDRDVSSQDLCNSEDDSALNLLHSAARVDDLPAVHGSYDSMDLHLPFFYRDLHDLGAEASTSTSRCQTLEMTSRQRFSPTRLLGGEFHRRQEPWVLRQERFAEFDW